MSSENQNNKPKILIIGAYGFLGQHFTKYCLKKDYLVYIGVKSTSKKPLDFSGTPIDTYYTDTNNFIDEIGQNSFEVVVYAAVNYGKNSTENELRHANVELPLKILSGLKKKEILFVHFDTFYNKFQNYNYLDNYSSSKREFKQLVKEHKGHKIVGLQLEHLYGPNDNPSKFIPTLFKRISSNDKDIKLTDGKQRRDFLFVDDLLILLDMLVHERNNIACGNYHFEIGTGNSVSILEFIQELKFQLGSTSNLIFGALTHRENEIMESKAKLDKIQSIVNWKPHIDFINGIKILQNIESNKSYNAIHKNK